MPGSLGYFKMQTIEFEILSHHAMGQHEGECIPAWQGVSARDGGGVCPGRDVCPGVSTQDKHLTVNKQVVLILLECILVLLHFDARLLW